MNNVPSKLALGTANFGLNYGVNNNRGKICDYDFSEIISCAKNSGIDLIDTAQAYGNAEKRLGNISKLNFKIITKISAGFSQNTCEIDINSLVYESMKRLKVKNLYAILIHRPELFLSEYGSKIIAQLKELKDEGVIKKIGVSIYDPSDLSNLLRLTDLDIVQAPFNIFDQRILASEWSHQLKKIGIEIHIRSVFLQGVLLMQRQKLPQYFLSNWPDLFDAWYEFQKDNNVCADEISLGFALKQSWVDKVIVGVDSVQQLLRLIQIESNRSDISNINFLCNDQNLIDPRNWNLK